MLKKLIFAIAPLALMVATVRADDGDLSFDLASISDTGCPVTVVQGDDDEVVEAAAVHRFVATSPLAPELIRFPDCGHFFHGRLTDLKALAKSRLPGALAG